MNQAFDTRRLIVSRKIMNTVYSQDYHTFFASASPVSTSNPDATMDPATDDTDASITTVNEAIPLTSDETSPADQISDWTDAVQITLSDDGWTTSDSSSATIKTGDKVTNAQTSTKYSMDTVTISAAGTYILRRND